MSNDKNHSEQFERYLKGQMSPEEAHAFEREVLNDPFAQEALEGFESQGLYTLDDLKYLRSRIRGKKSWPLMRIAAVIALLVVGTFTVYFFTVQIENDQLAMDEEPIEELTQSSPKPDTVSIAPGITEEAVSSEDFYNEENVGESEEREVERITDTLPLEEVTTEKLALKDDFEETDQLEGQGEAIQLAEVEALEEIVVEPTADEVIVMEEVVPTQAFTTKKKVAVNEYEAGGAVARSAARSSSSAKMDDQGIVKNTLPKPSIGDSLYQQYLKEELVYPDAAQENKIEGEVTLRLTINESGEIIDIKIEKSLGYGCDEEAIRLVEEGPSWNAAEINSMQVSDTARVSIQFKPTH